MLHFLFLDESGGPGSPKQGTTNYFVIGGVIFYYEDWLELQKKINDLKQTNNIDPWIEIKWRHIHLPPSYPKNPLTHLSLNEREKFAIDFFKIITRIKSLRLVATVTDKRKAYKKKYIQKPEDIYEHTLVPTIERFQYFLGHKQCYGIVIQDQRETHQDTHLRRFFQNLITKGTYWTKFPRIIEGIFLTASEYSIGIQCADFCVGAIFRKHERKDDTYFNIISNKFKGSWYKTVKDGLKYWP